MYVLIVWNVLLVIVEIRQMDSTVVLYSTPSSEFGVLIFHTTTCVSCHAIKARV